MAILTAHHDCSLCTTADGVCTQSDSGDPFNQFWRITEGMLDYLSQPVAFATAPLAPPSPGEGSRRRDGSSSSDTDLEDVISKRISRGIGLVKAARSRMLTRHDTSTTTADSENGRPGPSTFPPRPTQEAVRDDWDEEFGEDGRSPSYLGRR